jgi:hypothetical protein
MISKQPVSQGKMSSSSTQFIYFHGSNGQIIAVYTAAKQLPCSSKNSNWMKLSQSVSMLFSISAMTGMSIDE